MDTFLQQLVNGLTAGSVYAVVALGYTMVYGIIQLINFAHGEIFMIGGFGALTTYLMLPSGTTLLVAIPLTVAHSYLVAQAEKIVEEVVEAWNAWLETLSLSDIFDQFSSLGLWIEWISEDGFPMVEHTLWESSS